MLNYFVFDYVTQFRVNFELLIYLNSQFKKDLFYEWLIEDPLTRHTGIVNTAIEKFRKQELLINFIAKKLIIEEIRTPQFHILTKNISKFQNLLITTFIPFKGITFIYEKYIPFH